MNFSNNNIDSYDFGFFGNFCFKNSVQAEMKKELAQRAPKMAAKIVTTLQDKLHKLPVGSSTDTQYFLSLLEKITQKGKLRYALFLGENLEHASPDDVKQLLDRTNQLVAAAIHSGKFYELESGGKFEDLLEFFCEHKCVPSGKTQFPSTSW